MFKYINQPIKLNSYSNSLKLVVLEEKKKEISNDDAAVV
jgi:hypothetical protein